MIDWFCAFLDATLALLGGIIGGVDQRCEERGGWIDRLWRVRGRWRIHQVVSPEVAAHGGQRVGEGGLTFGVPGALAGRQGQPVEVVRHQGDETEQAEEAGHRPLDGAPGPVALGLDAEVTTRLLERHLDIPPPDVPGHDLERRRALVGAAQDGRLERAGRVAQQDLADGDGRLAVATPHRRVADHLERLRLAPIPRRFHRVPHRLGVVQDRAGGGQA